MFGGQWNVLMFHAFKKYIMFDDQWNVSMHNVLKIIECLVANGMFECFMPLRKI
jgi:hypothetical protein